MYLRHLVVNMKIKARINEELRMLPHVEWKDLLLRCRGILRISILDGRSYELMVYDAMKQVCRVSDGQND